MEICLITEIYNILTLFSSLTLIFPAMNQAKIILASSSPFRQALFQRLHLPFEAISPNIDESCWPNESARKYVTRLAAEKSRAIAQQHPDSVVIGCDQCAWLEGKILGKPGNHQNALNQLHNAQGKEVIFYTGLSVQRLSAAVELVDCIEFRVGFRKLSNEQLENYLLTEKPYNCAGSFKSEGYGITLFSYMSGDDPTALVGLPLIRLTSMLEDAGIEVL